MRWVWFGTTAVSGVLLSMVVSSFCAENHPLRLSRCFQLIQAGGGDGGNTFPEWPSARRLLGFCLLVRNWAAPVVLPVVQSNARSYEVKCPELSVTNARSYLSRSFRRLAPGFLENSSRVSSRRVSSTMASDRK